MSLKSLLFSSEKGSIVAPPAELQKVKMENGGALGNTAQDPSVKRSLTFSSFGTVVPTKRSAVSLSFVKHSQQTASVAPLEHRPLLKDTGVSLIEIERDQLKAKLAVSVDEVTKANAQIRAHEKHASQAAIKAMEYERTLADLKGRMSTREADISILKSTLETSSSNTKSYTDSLSAVTNELAECKALVKDHERRENVRESHIMDIGNEIVSIKETCQADVRSVLKCCRLELMDMKKRVNEAMELASTHKQTTVPSADKPVETGSAAASHAQSVLESTPTDVGAEVAVESTLPISDATASACACRNTEQDVLGESPDESNDAGDAGAFHHAPAHAAVLKDSQSAVVLNAAAAKAAAEAAQSAVKRAELARGEAINAVRDDFQFILATVASRTGSSSSVDVPLSTGDGTSSVVVNGVNISMDENNWTKVTHEQTEKLAMVPDDIKTLTNNGHTKTNTFHTSHKGFEDYEFHMLPLTYAEDDKFRFKVWAIKSDRS